jgi:hypothetical protein
MNFPSVGKVEFHCHTIASKDSLTRPADLVAAAQRDWLWKRSQILVSGPNYITFGAG